MRCPHPMLNQRHDNRGKMTMKDYVKVRFGFFDNENDPIYEGFYNPLGKRWNGWLNPYVTKEVFDKIMDDNVPKVFNPDWDEEEFWLDYLNQEPNKDGLYFLGYGLCWYDENDD